MIPEHYVTCSPALHWQRQPRNNVALRATYANKHISQSVHLVLTDSVAHLCLLECAWGGDSSQMQAGVVQVLAQDSRYGSKSCLSASAVLHGWERQDSRADFCVFLPGWRQSLPEHISTAAPEIGALSFYHSKLVLGRICLHWFLLFDGFKTFIYY